MTESTGKRRPTGGDPNRKALNLHHGVLIPDAFMEAVRDGALSGYGCRSFRYEVNAAGGFAEEIQVYYEDVDFCLRATRLGLRHLVDDGTFVVGAPNDFTTEWLDIRMRKVILQALAGVLGGPVQVAFEVIREDAVAEENMLLGRCAGPDADAVPAFLRRSSTPRSPSIRSLSARRTRSHTGRRRPQGSRRARTTRS